MDAGHAVKAVEGYLGHRYDVATSDNTVPSEGRKLVDNSGGEAIGVVYSGATVLQAAIEAHKQLIARKGVHTAIIAQNPPRTAVGG